MKNSIFIIIFFLFIILILNYYLTRKVESFKLTNIKKKNYLKEGFIECSEVKEQKDCKGLKPEIINRMSNQIKYYADKERINAHELGQNFIDSAIYAKEKGTELVDNVLANKGVIRERSKQATQNARNNAQILGNNFVESVRPPFNVNIGMENNLQKQLSSINPNHNQNITENNINILIDEKYHDVAPYGGNITAYLDGSRNANMAKIALQNTKNKSKNIVQNVKNKIDETLLKINNRKKISIPPFPLDASFILNGGENLLDNQAYNKNEELKKEYTKITGVDQNNTNESEVQRSKITNLEKQYSQFFDLDSNHYNNSIPQIDVNKDSGWHELNIDLAQISTSDDGKITWAINKNYNVFYKTILDNNFKKTDGSLSQLFVTGNGKQVWGVNHAGQVWLRKGINDIWRKQEGSLISICANYDGTEIWGCSKDGSVYYKTNMDKKWIKKDGIGINKITTSSNGKHILGLKTTGEIFYRKSRRGNWKPMDGLATTITVSNDGRIWCTGNSLDVQYKRNQNDTWERIPGRLKYISVSGNGKSLWGVDNLNRALNKYSDTVKISKMKTPNFNLKQYEDPFAFKERNIWDTTIEGSPTVHYEQDKDSFIKFNKDCPIPCSTSEEDCEFEEEECDLVDVCIPKKLSKHEKKLKKNRNKFNNDLPKDGKQLAMKSQFESPFGPKPLCSKNRVRDCFYKSWDKFIDEDGGHWAKKENENENGLKYNYWKQIGSITEITKKGKPCTRNSICEKNTECRNGGKNTVPRCLTREQCEIENMRDGINLTARPEDWQQSEHYAPKDDCIGQILTKREDDRDCLEARYICADDAHCLGVWKSDENCSKVVCLDKVRSENNSIYEKSKPSGEIIPDKNCLPLYKDPQYVDPYLIAQENCEKKYNQCYQHIKATKTDCKSGGCNSIIGTSGWKDFCDSGVYGYACCTKEPIYSQFTPEEILESSGLTIYKIKNFFSKRWLYSANAGSTIYLKGRSTEFGNTDINYKGANWNINKLPLGFIIYDTSQKLLIGTQDNNNQIKMYSPSETYNLHCYWDLESDKDNLNLIKIKSKAKNDYLYAQINQDYERGIGISNGSFQDNKFEILGTKCNGTNYGSANQILHHSKSNIILSPVVQAFNNEPGANKVTQERALKCQNLCDCDPSCTAWQICPKGGDSEGDCSDGCFNFSNITPYTNELKKSNGKSTRYANFKKANNDHRLPLGKSIWSNGKLFSPNQKYFLTNQTDGNVCIYESSTRKLKWCAYTQGNGTVNMTLKLNGDLEIATQKDNKVLWTQKPPFSDVEYVAVSNSGDLEFFKKDGTT